MTGGRHANKFHQKTPKFGYTPTKFDERAGRKNVSRFKIWHHFQYLCQFLGGYSKEDSVLKKNYFRQKNKLCQSSLMKFWGSLLYPFVRFKYVFLTYFPLPNNDASVALF